MKFAEKLLPNLEKTTKMLGYKKQAPDAVTEEKIQQAGRILTAAEQTKWVYKYYELGAEFTVPQANLALQGRDIQAHLAHCHGCILLALTLGDGVETAIRSAEASDMSLAVILDLMASDLIEQYAQQAQVLVQDRLRERELFSTPRYSPGYGDFPLDIQASFLKAVDAHRAIGLSASKTGILLPRKSITAVMGVAHQPVKGRLAGCKTCTLRDKCEWNLTKSGGKACATE